MRQELYPCLGTVVNYVRQNNAGEIEQGSGRILAVCLDASKRTMVHLDTETSITDLQGNVIPNPKFNVDILCLNPTPEFVKKFTEATQAVQAISGKGNKLVQEVVEDYNGRVELLYDGILGAPIEFEQEPVAAPEAVENGAGVEAAA